MGLLDKFMLTGKKAVVTGGARGIGQSVSEAFAEMGADVAVLDTADARETLRRVSALRRKGVARVVDITSEIDVERAFQDIEREFSTVDVVFNNAGICVAERAEQMTYDQWQRVIGVDLSGQFLVARAAGRMMIRHGHGGSIINVASMSGHIVNYPQGQCAYNAAKAGLIQLTRSLATEWARFGIRVNAISPGYMATEMTLPAPKEWQDIWFTMAPMKRLGTPDELQGVAVYLASAASSYTTGSDILVDGGFTCT